MMRRIPRWIIVAAAIVLACTGLIWWYNNLCSGEIDISESVPTQEMLLHIIEHADELAAREDLFSKSTDRNGHAIFSYTANAAYEAAYLWLIDTPDAYEIYGEYARRSNPDFFFLSTPWSELDITFTVAAPGILLVVNDYDAPSVSDAPLREMMSAIESIIGTP